VTCGPERLHEEVAYVAYHFHWALDDLLDLDHEQRRLYVDQIARINTKIAAG
jgi:hypothetical protein